MNLWKLFKLQGRLEQPAPPATPTKLAICSAFKNEKRYLKEWIEFYRLLGVERFYLNNNDSSDGYLSVLAPYLADGTVRLHRWHGKQVQVPGFNHCLKQYGHLHQWMAFLDLDEFMFPLQHQTLPEFLRGYEDFAGVAAHWVFFGTSGHILRPPGPVIQAYDWSQGVANRHVKLIVQPSRIVRLLNAHQAECREDFVVVNENRVPVTGGIMEPGSAEKIRINHYWSRSVEDFLTRKVPNGRASRGSRLAISQLFKAERKYRRVHDTVIHRFLPDLLPRLQ